MSKLLDAFERLARTASRFTEARPPSDVDQHPFELRNIHSKLPAETRRLFDNGHYAQATFEAFKFLDNEVQRHSASAKSGKALMMEALNESSPRVQLTRLSNTSERDEQEGYKFLFAGGMIAIRNPRGHTVGIPDDVDTCLDHLCFVSMLLRRLAAAGFHPA